MRIYSKNPLLLFRKIMREGTKISKLLALVSLVFAVIGSALAFLPHGIYSIERLGQILLGLTAVVYLYLEALITLVEEDKIEERIQKAERAVEENPEATRPLWDLARYRLELYFQRNLSQIRSIFWITVIVMVAGFILIGFGVVRAFDDGKMSGALLTTCAGVLTEFIAATFLVIYRSTLKQANSYVKTLERINAVGMAIQISETISGDEGKLRNETRAKLTSEIMKLFSSLEKTR